ncbi:hypothetical protein CR513_06154, partial [Mucuna pruriens]
MATKVFGICTSVEHPTDMCPTLQETDMGGNHIRLGQSITSNMEDNHFGQVRNKDRMQLREPNQCRACLKDQQVTNSRAYNIKHHLSNNNSNREYLLKKRKRTTLTYTTTVTEVSRSRLRTKCRPTVLARNCPLAISISDNLGKEARVRRRIVEDVPKSGNQYSTPRSYQTDPQVCKIPQGIMRTQKEKDEGEQGRRRGVSLDQR